MANIYGWVCLVSVLFGGGVGAGVALHGWWSQAQQRAMADRERAIRDEWAALERAQQLNAAFVNASTALVHEARAVTVQSGSQRAEGDVQ